jgi:hypothetical protein
MVDLALAFILATTNGAALPAPEARRYAQDIAAVARSRQEAALLVTVADAEGGFRRDVETCHVRGDAGAAWTLYQLHRHWIAGDPHRLCRSNRAATDTAGRVLRFLLDRTGGVAETFRAYIGCKHGDRRVETRMRTFGRLMEMADAR